MGKVLRRTVAPGRSRAAALGATGLLVMMATLAGCGGGSAGSEGSGGGGTVTLVAYSTPQGVYEELIPRFQKTEAGQGVSFEQSYGGSGSQSRAVAQGLDADVVALSLQPDVAALVDEGIVGKDWNSDPYNGMVTQSVVVFAVREGNPLNINSWDDLIKEGVDVITPNPITSGGARWNIMAAYGQVLQQGGTRKEALNYLRELFGNVSVLDPSARKSVQTFLSGKGDVLITYENEAITAQNNGADLEYVVPENTILIENPVAATKQSGPAAKAFIEFLHKPSSQQAFVQAGYRPVVDSVEIDRSRFPKPSGLFTIEEFGGWAKVQSKFFDPQSGRAVKILRNLGLTQGG